MSEFGQCHADYRKPHACAPHTSTGNYHVIMCSPDRTFELTSVYDLLPGNAVESPAIKTSGKLLSYASILAGRFTPQMLASQRFTRS